MPSYSYSEAAKTLDEETPLVTRADLLIVCKEIDEDTDEDETTAFISDAHALVCAHLDGWGISESILTLIEKYLSAHMAALTYPSAVRQGLGPMSETLALKVGMGFEATRYGQTAVGLDPTGTLAQLSQGKGQRSPSITSLGSGIIVRSTASLY